MFLRMLRNRRTAAPIPAPATPQDQHDERRQTDPSTIKRSHETLDSMPDAKLFSEAQRAAYSPKMLAFLARWMRVMLDCAVETGDIDIYTAAGIGPDYTYNVWDYKHWDRLQVHEWIARELARIDATENASSVHGIH